MEEEAHCIQSIIAVDSDLNVINPGNEQFMVAEADISELIDKTAANEQEAYDLYNDYAFRKGFSIRRSFQRRRANQGISMKQFCCSLEGTKLSKGKFYTKQDTRTGCKANVHFSVDENGVYTVTKHEMIHNHKLCPENKRHLLRSQRTAAKEDVDFLKHLVDNGVKLSDALRVLKKEKGGSPMLGFTSRDAYNEVSKEKRSYLEGSDANALIQIFMKRKEQEEDFFFDFELDDSGRLCNLFWRDGQMKKDYDNFGDCLIHDTTYRTNRYDMICAPFVGINHHGKNIMFGLGFLTNEKTESFIWLFQIFLKSLGEKQPATIMTDQSAAMAAAIKVVFTKSYHRLCVWHILENSKKHIRHLRALKGFVELFDQVLKYVDTVAEFNFYWHRLVTDYECEKNEWLTKLYKCKDKWCPAFSKDFFSGGILSSQRSESTNHSISRRLYATAGLCDFYSCFVDVIDEWRSKENGEDFRSLQGNPEMIANHINILMHARVLYTVDIYYLFEEQYLKSMALHQYLQESDGNIYVYHVGKSSKEKNRDLIQHVVTFNEKEMSVYCTCKMYSQVGVLCSHSLRILNFHCVDDIPKQYILKRWTKEAISINNSESTEHVQGKHGVVSDSVWRTQMSRKFNELIATSQSNIRSREYLEESYVKTKDLVLAEIGCIETVQSEVCSDIGSSVTAIQNPSKSRQPGQRNKRKQSTSEKISNIVRGRKARAFRAANHTNKSAQASIQQTVNSMVGAGYLVHPPNGGHVLMPVVPSTQFSPCLAVNPPYPAFVRPELSSGNQGNMMTQLPTFYQGNIMTQF